MVQTLRDGGTSLLRQPETKLTLGIHVAGVNTQKTSAILFKSNEDQIYVESLYSNIGTSRTLHVDDRILAILSRYKSIDNIFFDCPLTLPPCVRCVRDACPGQVRCDDMSINYMQSLEQNHLLENGRKRRVSINPEQQRLWDIWHSFSNKIPNFQSSYGANLSPLVIRARSLMRRILTQYPSSIILETNIQLAVMSLLSLLDHDVDFYPQSLFSDLSGDSRKVFLDIIQENFSLHFGIYEISDFTNSPNAFKAFVTGFIGCLHLTGKTSKPPVGYLVDEGWVYLPSW